MPGTGPHFVTCADCDCVPSVVTCCDRTALSRQTDGSDPIVRTSPVKYGPSAVAGPGGRSAGATPLVMTETRKVRR